MSEMILKGAKVYANESAGFVQADVLISEGIVKVVEESIHPSSETTVFDCSGKVIVPGFVDVHVHLREPGFLYKETVKTGTLAGAAGGYTTVCPMPNLNPVPDSLEHLEPQLEAIRKDACIEALPFGSITVGEAGEEISDMEALAPFVCGFSDDGKGVENEKLMREAMTRAKKLGKVISAHCEFKALSAGGAIHDGRYAKEHGIAGVSSESEWREIERDVRLAKETGCSYHVCHVSTKESIAIIRQAKSEGIDVTCETAPHYLTLTENDLIDSGDFKMAPPLRTEEDRQALLAAILDGTLDMIATDHAPHSAEEKSRGLAASVNGIVGLETAFPVLYTELVKKNFISLEKLVFLMSIAPRERFGIAGGTGVGDRADLAVLDLDEEYEIRPEAFKTMGRSTPFAGRRVFGRPVMTISRGEVKWTDM